MDARTVRIKGNRPAPPMQAKTASGRVGGREGFFVSVEKMGGFVFVVFVRGGYSENGILGDQSR